MTALADLHEPRTTIGGVNLVIGMRPELWRNRLGGTPGTAHRRRRVCRRSDGYTMPTTQHDAQLWQSGSSYDVVFARPIAGSPPSPRRRARSQYCFVPSLTAIHAFATAEED